MEVEIAAETGEILEVAADHEGYDIFDEYDDSSIAPHRPIVAKRLAWCPVLWECFTQTMMQLIREIVRCS